MPTYEYVCEDCKHQFDLFQFMSEETLKTCPECGKDELRRLFGTGSAILFKGSGFYETDYRSESYKDAAKADTESSSSSSSKDNATDSSGTTKSESSGSSDKSSPDSSKSSS